MRRPNSQNYNRSSFLETYIILFMIQSTFYRNVGKNMQFEVDFFSSRRRDVNSSSRPKHVVLSVEQINR